MCMAQLRQYLTLMLDTLRTTDLFHRSRGDSWRARVSHICELQVNLYSGAMKIDFGGLDRWDYSERQRNIQEANLPIA